MKVADARDGLRLEKPEKFHDILMGIEGDLLTEINEQ